MLVLVLANRERSGIRASAMSVIPVIQITAIELRRDVSCNAQNEDFDDYLSH